MTDADRPTAVQFGVGPIGARIVELAVDHGYEFLGGIDIDPQKVGSDLGTVVGIGELGAPVSDEQAILHEHEPDVVFHATGSAISSVRPQLEDALSAGADVISTCEELSYPFWHHQEDAEAIDAVAREHGVSCLGTGINPGFAMDALPAFVTAACQRVDSIRVERVQDAATRRAPLQEKIGAGTSVEAFESEVATEAGHVGLPESVAMLAAGLGWELESIDERIQPVVADERTSSDHITVDPGSVAGISQTATGTVDGRTRIELSLEMYLGAPDPGDSVTIDGTPSLTYSIPGGFHGDMTTPAVVLNAARQLRAAPPGLRTMLDLSIPACGAE